MLEVKDGKIVAGGVIIHGHGCTTPEQMQHYCDTLNSMVTPEDIARAERSAALIAELSPETRRKLAAMLSFD